jgi:hypothetical protein
MQRANLDGSRVPALDEHAQKVGRLLPMYDAGEGAVLTLNEHAAVNEPMTVRLATALREHRHLRDRGDILERAERVSAISYV